MEAAKCRQGKNKFMSEHVNWCVRKQAKRNT